MAAAEFNMHSWFADDELEPCPRCRNLKAVTAPETGIVVCLDCGVIGVRAEKARRPAD